MKDKKADRNLRELFSKNLEKAEVSPGPSLSMRLMQKLAVREFLRFNPLRMNVYYLGAMLVAGVTAVLVLTSSPEKKEKVPEKEIITQQPLKDSTAYNPNSQSQPSTEKIKAAPANPVSTVKQSDENKNINSTFLVKTEPPKSETRSNQEIVTGTVNEPLKTADLFQNRKEEPFKLKDRLQPGEQLFETSVTEGCAPLKVQFNTQLSESDSCQWNFGDGGSSGLRNPEWIFDVEGDYKVILTVFENGRATGSYSRTISVFQAPSARFEISAEKAMFPDDEVRFHNYSNDAVRYLWNFGDGSTSDQFEPVYSYGKHGNYNVTLKVYSEKGCADSLVVYNAFSGSSFFIEFPNAFIPNIGGPSGGVYSTTSDESAQVFHPSYSGVSEYHLKIFSKLGVLLFETTDLNIGWDGYFKGQLSNPGVYIWKVRGNFSNGEPFTKMGDVTLLKN